MSEDNDELSEYVNFRLTSAEERNSFITNLNEVAQMLEAGSSARKHALFFIDIMRAIHTRTLSYAEMIDLARELMKDPRQIKPEIKDLLAGQTEQISIHDFRVLVESVIQEAVDAYKLGNDISDDTPDQEEKGWNR